MSGGADENAATPAVEPAARACAARRAHRPRTGTPPSRNEPASAVATGPAPTTNVVGLRAVMEFSIRSEASCSRSGRRGRTVEVVRGDIPQHPARQQPGDLGAVDPLRAKQLAHAGRR